MKPRMFVALTIAILALLVLRDASSAQDYPAHPVRVIVPYGAGSPDTTARIITARLSEQTGQSFIVENHPGASGQIGAAIVVRSPPDGYTLLLTTDSISLLPSTTKSLPFDVQKDLMPVSRIGETEASFLVVNNNLPVHNLRELIAYAHDSKNKLKYGSSGIGSAAHLRMAVFAKKMSLPLLHIPFKGLGDAVTGLLGGAVQAMFVIAPTALPLIKGGKIRAIAYDYSTRAKFLPDVPTMDEGGVPPSTVSSSWHGVFAPAKTPETIVTWLSTQIHQAVEDPATRQKLENVGMNPVGSTSAQFQQTVSTYIAAMHDAVTAAGIEPQ
jgi:tripartite-type tricarboxylate transporter receptor subunit TctC